MPLFKRRTEIVEVYVEPKPVFATAKVDMYAMGNLIRVGEKIDTRNPIFINMPYNFDYDPAELKNYGQ